MVKKDKEKEKEKVSLMFASHECGDCIWSKAKSCEDVKFNILEGVNLVLQVFVSLVKLLWLLDGDRKPSIRFLVGGLEDAKCG